MNQSKLKDTIMVRNLCFILIFSFLVVLGQDIVAQDNPLFLNTDYSLDERIEDLIQRMTLEEKVSQMQHTSPAIPRLDIPEYNWWNEALHGVGRSGVATVFPQAIGLGATFDENLVHKVATVISDEARAMHHTAVAKGYRQQYGVEGRTYRYMEEEPLYPFGFGLSYADFEYSDIEIILLCYTKG